jgi:serpin B
LIRVCLNSACGKKLILKKKIAQMQRFGEFVHLSGSTAINLKKNFMKHLIFTLLFSAFILSCSKSDNPANTPAEPIVLQPQTRAILVQSNSFAFDLFRAVSQQQGENLFLSPYSVSGVLGMLYNGADGETKAEIASVLGMESYTPEQVNEYYKELTTALLKVDPKTKLALANAIWANRGYTLKTPFISLNQAYYDAKVSTLDFSQSSALKTINDWCNDKTKGTIPKMIDQLNPSTAVILANAIYFKSIWTEKLKFDKSKTLDKPFYNFDGTVSTVPRMHQTPLVLLYAQMEGFGMVTLPYSNGAFAMNLILPDMGVDMGTLVEELDGEVWQTIVNHREDTQVTLSMPRFKQENNLERLADILSALGMPSAFSSTQANFSAMMDAQVAISKVVQKSYISVDEEGTVAAAVTYTGLDMSPGPLPNPKQVTIVVDRPFLFVITEQSTGAILFMGKMVKL